MDSRSLESPLVRVPFESLKRTARDRKYALDSVDAVLAGLGEAAAEPGTPACAAAQRLGTYIEELQRLKRKLDSTGEAEREDVQRLGARLQHLQELGSPSREQHIEWSRQRVDRLLVDHLLRCGYHATAAKLIEAAGVQDIVDMHIFESSRRVVESLGRHDCSEALAWCEENRAKLRKSKSKLEFRLRVQEFIELVRAGQMGEAIGYARQHLAPFAPAHMAELQRAVATLAFKAGTDCAPYSRLFDEAQWSELVELFHKELYKLNSLTPVSLLSVHLQAGLSALKTPQSLAESCSREDPLHLPAFRALASGLPFAKHVHSKLVCAVTKQIMDEHNPPFALPNGYVYSEQAVQQLAAAGSGKVTCPRTGEEYDVAELRRVFIS